METALESRELASIAALYQTNDVTAAELKSELARWGHACEVGSKPVSLVFKPLGTLPPESRRFWTEETRCLTRFQVTHVVMVRANELALTLPLNLVGDKFLIVPSEKLSDKSIEPAANGSRSILSQTNQVPAAPGPRR